MILCIDVGGTKTLLALAESIDDQPHFQFEQKVPTPSTYEDFIAAITDYINEVQTNIDAVSIGYPGRVRPNTGTIEAAENISWGHKSLREDLHNLIPDATILVENDANLGGLTEALSGSGSGYSSVYYITVSTGIGGGYVTDQHINTSVANSEPGHMLIQYDNKQMLWESLASGKAFVNRFAHTAEETPEDSPSWDEYAKLVAPGLINVIALMQPEVIVIGGSMGAHFKKWEKQLDQQLNGVKPEFLVLPAIKAAHHPESAVLEGAFYYAKQNS